MTEQNWLDGMAPKKVRAIHDAAARVLATKAAEKAAKEKREAAEEDLLAAMHKHKVETYRFNGISVMVDRKEKVKVEGKPETEEAET